MSTTVDERVVSMKFDNAQFERETRTTMSTLDRLKEKLNFSGASKGLDEVNQAAKKVDFNPMMKATEALQTKFSHMQMTVQHQLNQMVDSAIAAGKRIVSSLTVDPIKTGLQEYETKINAVQVIRANTMGKNTMEEIMAALDELNTYADKTIYNFAQMTNNVGKFVAQGLDVKQATNAIQGMANLAAASGASAEDMSRATYQMSQALGGVIRRIDWNSLRNANMATTTLKETLMDIARVEGIKIDKMIKEKGTFEETLEKGWLTGELFTKAMNIYSGVYSEAELKAMKFTDEQIKKFQDIAAMASSAATEVKTITQLWDVLKEAAQSGWTQTWEYVIGDFETAKADLSKAQNFLSGMLNNIAEERNQLFKGWNEAGGRDMLIESVVNIFKAIESVVAPIREAFRDIFPPTTVEQLLKLTEGIKNFTAGLKISDKTSANLKSTFRGLFAAVDIVWKVFKAVLTALKPIVKLFGDITGRVLGATGSFGEWIVALNEFIDKSGILTNVAEGIALVFKKMIDFAKKYLTPFIDGIQNGLSRLFNGAADMKDGVVGAVEGMGSAIEKSSFFKVLQGLWKIVHAVGSAITKIFGSAIGNILDSLAGADFSKLLDFLNTLSLGGIAIAISRFLMDTTSWLSLITDHAKTFVKILDSVRDCLEAFQTSIKATAILKIAIAVGILAISLAILASLDSAKLTVALVAISTLFAELMASMTAFNKLNMTKDVAKSTVALIGFSTAIFILASALRMAASADIDNMVVAGGAIVGLMYAMTHVAKLLGSGNKDKKVIKGTMAMIGFATAIFVLAGALRMAAGADIDNMVVATLSIGTLMYAMVGVAKLLGSKIGQPLTMAATGMVGFASAIFILAGALRMVATLELTEMAMGLGGIITLMLTMVGVAKLLSKNVADLTGVGFGLLLIAGAVDLLVIAVKELGKLDFPTIGKGVVSIAVLLAAFAGFSQIVKAQSGTIIWTGIAMIPMAAAMIVFAKAVEKFGKMDTKTLGHGMTALAVGLAALTAALAIMAPNATGVVKASAAIAIVAGSLLLLAGALKIFETISWETLGKAATVFGVLIGLFIALGVLSAFKVTMLALEAACLYALQLAGAMALAGLAVLEFGAGLALAASAVVIFGVGLSAIAIGMEALGKAMPVFAQGFFDTIHVILDGIASFGPNAAASIANGISIMCQAIALTAEDIASLVITLIDEICFALIDIVPSLVETFYEIYKQALEVLVDYVPDITNLFYDFLVTVFDSLAVKLPELSESLTNLMMVLFATLIEAFNQVDFRTVLDGMGALTVFVMLLGSFAYLAPVAIAGLTGLANIAMYLMYVVGLFGLLWSIPFVADLMDNGAQMFEALGIAIGAFIGGIIGGINLGATSTLPEIADHLSEFMAHLRPFIDGVKNIDESTMNSIQALAGAILTLTASSVIDSLTSWLTGGSSIVDFGKQLAEFGPHFKSYYNSIKGIDGEVVVASANAAKALSEMATNLPNQGGLVSWVTGDNTLAKFAEELKLFGPALKSYASSVSGLDVGVVTNSINAATAISEMAANLPNQGGLVSWVTGDNTLAKFAEELKLFGPSMKQYATDVSGINPDVVVASANAAKALAEMATIIPNLGGLISWFEGENSLSVFGSELVIFGGYMKQYSDKVSGLKVVVVSTSATAGMTLATMAQQVSATKTSGLLSFGTSLATFGANFKKFIDNLKNVSVEKIQSATAALKEIINVTNVVSETNASGLSSLGESLGSFASSAIDEFVNAFTDAKERVETAASDLLTNFGNALDTNSDLVTSEFDAILTDILTAANNQYDDFKTAGSYLVEGFASGISDKTWMAEAKATAMAEAALDAARAALDEHSPSKKFYKIGAFAGEGFVNAFSDYESTSYGAGSGIAEAARKGLSNAVRNINRFISSDLDTQPTIRPILDLSDLKSGANAIGGMFGMGSSIGVMSNVNSINSMMNRRNQNGVNGDVVSAINKLRGDLENISKPSYNINGITYDSGTDIADAIETLVRATVIERRI